MYCNAAYNAGMVVSLAIDILGLGLYVAVSIISNGTETVDEMINLIMFHCLLHKLRQSTRQEWNKLNCVSNIK